jgi:hypothetical protein
MQLRRVGKSTDAEYEHRHTLDTR